MTLFTALAIAAAPVMGESPASATVLEGSVRAGDRSGLFIRRPPPDGGPRFNRFTEPYASAPRGGDNVGAIDRPGGSVAAVRGLRRRDAPARHDWFWAIHAPAAEARQGRGWDEVRATLAHWRGAHGGIHAERGIAQIAGTWADPISRAARAHRVSEALIVAVIAVESAGQPRATSPKGAQGLMQLIPATARRFGVANSYDPAANIEGGAAYLDFLLDRFGGDVVLALAGYNAGEGAVDKHRGVPPFRETRDYVVKVLDALVTAERLCALPPEGPRYSCLWEIAER